MGKREEEGRGEKKVGDIYGRVWSLQVVVPVQASSNAKEAPPIFILFVYLFISYV
jgi:hypothetical protein